MRLAILITSIGHYEKEASGIHAKQQTQHSPSSPILFRLAEHSCIHHVDLSSGDSGLINTLLGEATLVGALVSGGGTTA